MVKDIICVACPMGCQISVELNDDGELPATPASAATPTREPSAPTPREA